ncbi:MAG: isoaspartyl peptidase/L-asparaginase, partial [Chloroflexota bacterium]
ARNQVAPASFGGIDCHDEMAAAEAVIKKLAERVNGLGGIIVVDARGNVGHAFNTPRMARAWVTPDGQIVTEC